MGDFKNDDFFNKARFCWLLVDSKVVGPVWDQKNTWTCWAHVVRDTVTAVDYLKTKNLNILSIQELVDCMFDKFYPGEVFPLDTHGNRTSTSSFSNGYSYVFTHGLYSEEDYPFEERKGTCRVLLGKRKTSIKGYHVISESDWKGMEDSGKYSVLEGAIETTPTGAAIRFYKSFKEYNPNNYNEGIYVPTEEEVDDRQNGRIAIGKHAVVVIGYGVSEMGVEYFLIKNSMGTDWGHNGYAKVKRDLLTNFAYPYDAYLKEL